MCIKKGKLRKILKDHPEERKFLVLRAKKRYVNLKNARNKAREEEVRMYRRQHSRLGFNQRNPIKRDMVHMLEEIKEEIKFDDS